jgi:hypothetical protein
MTTAGGYLGRWLDALGVIALLGALGVVATLCAGCGGVPPQRQHDVLNRVTDVADPTYAVVLETCDAARNAIVERGGTTYEEDTAAMDEIDRVCDPIVAGMESLRGTQRTVRAAIDAGAEGAILEGLQHALELWRLLQEKIPELQTLGSGGAP